MKHVHVTKVSPQNGGLEENFQVFGHENKPPEVGKPYTVWRYKRIDSRGEHTMAGEFTTSTVVEITPTGIKTKNSEYKIEEIDSDVAV